MGQNIPTHLGTRTKRSVCEFAGERPQGALRRCSYWRGEQPWSDDTTLYKQRHKIENMFGRLKDWRRVATRYDRCAHTFFSAICIAAAVTFWL
nr:transposase [Afifella marina]